MQKKCKKSGITGVFLLVMLLAAIFGFHSTTKEASAATQGFVKINGKTYYYDANGKKHTGWLTLNGNKYYFYTKSGKMATGYVRNSKGICRYFFKGSGIMATGWVTTSKGKKMYFDPKNGNMLTGWKTYSNGKKRYFSTTNGYMATGWQSAGNGTKRYFYSGSGYMATGLVKASNGKYRYFDPDTGILTFGYVKDANGTRYFYKNTGYMATGWVTNSKGQKKYFDPSTGYVTTGTATIDGYRCVFSSSGILLSKEETLTLTTPSSERTLKNYLAGAMQPVGQALYVWGGGWTDSTRKGVSPLWKEWYDSQDEDYDYNEYRDLTASTRAKGLDCSGFVGWSAYQVMQTKSGVGSGYTVVSGDVGSHYKALGWGTILTQASLAKSDYTLRAGDVGYNSGHTWIVVGQCSDKSIVIVHSTPQAGCQLAGTPTPEGNYQSEAVRLAEKYMSRYAGFQKYQYNTSTGNYVKNGNYLRWNSTTLSDPDGYANKTADMILADLFKY